MEKIKGHMNVFSLYNVFNDKNIRRRTPYDQIHFTPSSEEFRSIIEHSVEDDVLKNILTTILN